MTGNTGQDTATERRQPDEERRREHTNLDHRYGRIGISAVVAALPYAKVSKNPAYAPVVAKIDARFADAVA